MNKTISIIVILLCSLSLSAQSICNSLKLDTTHYLVLQLKMKNKLFSKKVDVLLPNHMFSKNYQGLSWERINESYYKAKEVLQVDSSSYLYWKRLNLNERKLSLFRERYFRSKIVVSNYYTELGYCDSIAKIAREIEFRVDVYENREEYYKKRRLNRTLASKFDKYISKRMKRGEFLLDRILDDEFTGGRKYVFLLRK